MMNYASHPRAIWVLNLISFAESSFFPLPPDPLYIAMILKNRDSAWQLALMCTISSVLGGFVGYYIGYALYETVGKWIIDLYSLQNSFESFKADAHTNGFWLIALKGLTPIPFKIVTIASGAVQFDLLKFTIAAVIARSFRFATLGYLLWRHGEPIKDYIDNNLTLVTTMGFGALILGFVVLKYIF
jgi:membrane protein YqaA with SNARE-associated domain